MRPSGLGPRGSVVWRALAPANSADIGRALLASEAARLADRLDQLHAVISGDSATWALVEVPKAKVDGELALRVDITSAVSEARQTANVLRQIVAQLNAAGAGGGAGSPVEAGRAFVAAIVSEFADGGVANSDAS